MTDQITRLLDQINRIEKKSTPGPWVANDLGIGYEITTQQQIDEAAEVNGWPLPINSGIKDTFPRSDAEFIALARTFTPALSRAVRAVLELHKTRVHGEDPTSPFCNFCGPGTPCETTRAITDALKGQDDAA